ncbi:Proline-tRNA ligase, partial [human gut metagenome]
AIVGDAGAMGGSDSKEFSAPAAAGEDIIAYSDTTDYAANLEMAKDFYERQKPTLSAEPLEKIDTPNEKTIEELSQLLDVPAEKLAKTI